MIKFVPKERHIRSQLGEPEEWVTNLANKSLASQMESRFGNYYCDEHPDFVNCLEVDFYKGIMSVPVLDCCCEKFKERLDLFGQNKNPFTENEESVS